MTAGDEQQADAQPPDSVSLSVRAFTRLIAQTVVAVLLFFWVVNLVLPVVPPPIEVRQNGAVFVYRGTQHWLVPHPLAALGSFTDRYFLWALGAFCVGAFAFVLASGPTEKFKRTKWDQNRLYSAGELGLGCIILILVLLVFLLPGLIFWYPDPVFRLLGCERLPRP